VAPSGAMTKPFTPTTLGHTLWGPTKLCDEDLASRRVQGKLVKIWKKSDSYDPTKANYLLGSF